LLVLARPDFTREEQGLRDWIHLNSLRFDNVESAARLQIASRMRNTITTVRLLAVVLSMLSMGSANASADPIAADRWYWFQWGSNGVAFSGTLESSSPNYAPPGAFGEAPGATPWTYVAPRQGAMLLVVDTNAAGDQFEIFDSGQTLGLTSSAVTDAALGTPGFDPYVALANPNLSRGEFALDPGLHSLMIRAVQNPFGGGGAWFRIDESTAVPEPSTLMIFGLGASLYVLRRSRRLQPVRTSD
jgi:hypothetical protein